MMAVLQLAWAYRKYVASVLALVVVYVIYGMWHHHVFDLGVKAEDIVWQARIDKQRAAYDKAIEQQRVERDAIAAHNAQVVHDYNQQLLSIANDRDSLARRVRDYQARIAALGDALSQAGSAAGPAGAGQVASGESGFDAAFDAYDRACRDDAAKLEALQEAVRPIVSQTPPQTGASPYRAP